MAGETLGTLLYGAAINLDELRRSATAARAQLEGIGDVATKTFDQKIARSLANSVKSADFVTGVNNAKKVLSSLGTDVAKTFERSLGRNLANQTLGPFVDQSTTFLGQLKAGFTSTLGVGKIALGVGLGGVIADVVRGLSSAAVEAVNFAAQFELALAKVQTIADRGFNIEQVGEQLKDLSTRIPQTATALAEGLFGIIGSGISETSEALNVLETSAKAAVAGISSTAASAKSIVFVLNAYGKSAEDAAHVSDILFKTVDEGVVEFNDLAAVIGDVVGPAALAGASIEDVGAALSVMTKAGISAAESATAVRRLLGEIVSPSEKAAAAAKRLGIDLSKAGLDAAGGFKPFIDQITRLTRGDITTLRELFPEERAFRAISILAGTMAGEFQRLGDEFNDLNQVAGATDRAFNIINETAEFQFKLFKNNLSVAVLELGSSILNFLKPALEGINELFDDTTPLDKTIARMKELGVEAEKIEMLTLQSSLVKTQEELRNLQGELDRTILSLQNAEESFVALAQAGGGESERTIAFAKGAELVTEQFAKQLSTVDGLITAEERRNAINTQLREVLNLLGIAQSENDAARVKALELTRDNLDGQITALDQLIAAQNNVNAAVAQEESARRRIQLIQEFEASTREEIQKRAQDAISATEAIEKQIDAAKKARDKEVETNLRDNLKAQKEIVSVAKLFVTVQEDVANASVDAATASETQRKEAEKLAEATEKLRLQLDAIGASSDIERQLTGIRQKADAERKSNTDNLAAIKIVNAIERAEIAKTIEKILEKSKAAAKGFQVRGVDVTADLQKQIRGIQEVAAKRRELFSADKTAIENVNQFEREQIAKTVKAFEDKFKTISRERIEAAINATLPVVLKVPVGLEVQPPDISGLQRASDDIRDAMSNIAFPIESFIVDLDNLGIRVDDQFFELIGLMDKGLANTLQAISQFSASLISEDIVGSILGGLNLIKTFVGGLDPSKAIRRAETEARNERIREHAARLAADAAERAATALENLRRAADAFNAGQFIAAIEKLNKEFGDITGTIETLTSDEQRRALELLEEAEVKRVAIALRLSRGFGETDATVIRLRGELAALQTQLNEFGINIDNVTAAELDRIRALLQEKGILDAAVKQFQAFGDGLRGLLDRLQLGFELLGTVDPSLKLDELVKALTDTFSFKVPEQFENLNEFVLAGFEALKQGGQALIDFLISANLEELTAEEFADLLRTLHDFSKGVEGAGVEAEDALAAFLEKLQLQMDILDIEDPIQQLEFFRQAIIDTFGVILPDSISGLEDFVRQGFTALSGDAETLRAILAGLGLEELTAEQFKDLLLQFEGLLDGIGSKFSALQERLNLQFDLLNIDDFEEKMRRLREALVREFNAVLPEVGEGLEQFIVDGVNALLAGGDKLKQFLTLAGLEELSAVEFEELLRALRELQDEAVQTGAVIGTTADAFANFVRGFETVIDVLDITDPTEKLRLFGEAVDRTFGTNIPKSFDGLKQFITQGLFALQGNAEQLKIFLESIGLEELTREQFEDLLQQLEGNLDAIGSKFAQLTDRLNLEFDLLDVEDPIKKLARLQDEIRKRFNAVIPTTVDEIDELIAQGVAALLEGGEQLRVFLASLSLEELTAEEFEGLLRTLKDFADEAAKQIDGATKAAEEITTSQVKSITFTQGNKLIDEVTTIRIVVTQMLDSMRLGGFPVAPGVDLSSLIAASTGLSPAVARNNYFLVRNGTVEPISENQLSDIDRRLIEQSRAAAQARGIG